MNWSEPSIRAEQALKRANQAAENGALLDAITEWNRVVHLAHEAMKALHEERYDREHANTPT